MTPTLRPHVLAGLADIVRRHRDDPVTGGLEAVRLLRWAGATWTDLLGPVDEAARYCVARLTCGPSPSLIPRQCGQAVMTLAHLAPPFELARAAVLANAVPPTKEASQELGAMVCGLVERSETETA